MILKHIYIFKFITARSNNQLFREDLANWRYINNLIMVHQGCDRLLFIIFCKIATITESKNKKWFKTFLLDVCKLQSDSKWRARTAVSAQLMNINSHARDPVA